MCKIVITTYNSCGHEFPDEVHDRGCPERKPTLTRTSTQQSSYNASSTTASSSFALSNSVPTSVAPSSTAPSSISSRNSSHADVKPSQGSISSNTSFSLRERANTNSLAAKSNYEPSLASVPSEDNLLLQFDNAKPDRLASKLSTSLTLSGSSTSLASAASSSSNNVITPTPATAAQASSYPTSYPRGLMVPPSCTSHPSTSSKASTIKPSSTQTLIQHPLVDDSQSLSSSPYGSEPEIHAIAIAASKRSGAPGGPGGTPQTRAKKGGLPSVPSMTNMLPCSLTSATTRKTSAGACPVCVELIISLKHDNGRPSGYVDLRTPDWTALKPSESRGWEQTFVGPKNELIEWYLDPMVEDNTRYIGVLPEQKTEFDSISKTHSFRDLAAHGNSGFKSLRSKIRRHTGQSQDMRLPSSPTPIKPGTQNTNHAVQHSSGGSVFLGFLS